MHRPSPSPTLGHSGDSRCAYVVGRYCRVESVDVARFGVIIRALVRTVCTIRGDAPTNATAETPNLTLLPRLSHRPGVLTFRLLWRSTSVARRLRPLQLAQSKSVLFPLPPLSTKVTVP
ncbi:hypothetical protein PG991_013906 [Apiospora marii]|uniref:Uncharacterized protein n=1 Tax=Apiospora marii TaxID=335849 RepID=A0ABR1R7F9_9PEZI